MIAVGNSLEYDTKVAFYNSLNKCNVKDISLALVFAGARHDPNFILLAAQEKLPGIPVFGGSIVGTVTRDAADYSGYEMTVIVFTNDINLPQVVNSDPSAFTDNAIGDSLGRAVIGNSKNLRSLIMFYTSVADTKSRELHYATSILNAFSEMVKNPDLQVAGGGLLTGFNFEDSWAIGNNKVHRHYAFAILFPDHIKLNINVLRACQPTGPVMVITGISGSRITSINNKPALEVICLLLNRKPGSRGNILSLNLCIGLIKNANSGKKINNNQINRVIVSEDINDNSISLLEPDFHIGDHVQLMLRDNDYMISNASYQETDKPIFSMYIDCAGRASILTGSSEEEGMIAMSSIPIDTPSVGIYSGVEIASISGTPTALDLTGVMVSLVNSYAKAL